MAWIRTCQECGNRQPAKPPSEYKGDTWRNLKCHKCKSEALDYGRDDTPTPSLDPDYD